ncbi:ATP-grasp domain-containing protein [Streptomyces sp. SID8376]|uniref:ATP-grasp domain-containing protein n=1 Tax=unclassified Streptomyces TaxID=2593676 RepID=UPI0003656EB8|nr:ATP-grasp domain-containing protein [Streptomyces sp. SID8376]
MPDTSHRRSKLVFVDGPGGPPLDWYLPRLCNRHDVAVLWMPTGDESADAAKQQAFTSWGCRSWTFQQGQDLIQLIKDVALSERANGVLSFSELWVIDTHTAAAELGLAANPLSSVPAMRDKYLQRQRLAEAGVPTPRFALVQSAAQLQDAYEHVGAPAIFKPVTGAGSLATYAVDPSTDLQELWEAAHAAHENDRRGGKTATFILEERLIGVNKYQDERYGDYASVESIVHDGRITHLAVTDKFPLTEPFRENGGILPSVLPTKNVDELYSAASAAIEALGLTHCALHTEFKLTATGPVIIEVNCRVGGGVTEQLYYAAAYDIVEALAEVALGKTPPSVRQFKAASAIMLPQIPPRHLEIAHAPTVDDLIALPGVVSAKTTYAPGARPRWVQGTSAGMLARIVAVAPDANTLLETFDYLMSDKCFTYTESFGPSEQ